MVREKSLVFLGLQKHVVEFCAGGVVVLDLPLRICSFSFRDVNAL